MTQDQAFEIMKTGTNVFVTGSAGSGKTHLVNRYVAYLKNHGVDVAVTASTGIAATHIGGTTIHSWSGLGIRDSLSDYDLELMEDKQYLFKRFENTKVLIIDEISMLHYYRLDMVEKIIRHFRRTTKPFGGIQIILVGDFFQLPPIKYGSQFDSDFAFKSQAWLDGDFTICYLTEQHRQTDINFISILNAIREGTITPDLIEIIKNTNNKRFFEIEPTRLYTHNIDVDTINQKELTAVKGKEIIYDMSTRGGEKFVDSLKKSCLAPEFLRLKVGARVMCVKNNFEAGFANGTLGIVVSCGQFKDPVIRIANGKEIKIEKANWQILDDTHNKIKAEITQYPLRLAWAITIHKSQGMSLDAIEVDLSKSFEKGMGYVALSRVRSLEGLNLLGINENALQVSSEVFQFNKELIKLSDMANEAFVTADMELIKKAQETFLSFIGGTKNKKDQTTQKKRTTYDITKDFLLSKTPLESIAKDRAMTKETIISHLEKIVEEDRTIDIAYVANHLSQKKIDIIQNAIQSIKSQSTGEVLLAPVKTILGAGFSFIDIRLIRLLMKKEGLI